MTTPPDAGEFQAKLQNLEALVRQAERLPDPAAREQLRQVVTGLLELHAVGLERLLGHVAAGEGGDTILDACVEDDLVTGLLLLHGLHPHGLEERVEQAVEELRSHADVELLNVDDGVVRLRVEGGCGCSSSGGKLRQTIEEAVYARARDATAVEIEGLEAEANADGRFALPVV